MDAHALPLADRHHVNLNLTDLLARQVNPMKRSLPSTLGLIASSLNLVQPSLTMLSWMSSADPPHCLPSTKIASNDPYLLINPPPFALAHLWFKKRLSCGFVLRFAHILCFNVKGDHWCVFYSNSFCLIGMPICCQNDMLNLILRATRHGCSKLTVRKFLRNSLNLLLAAVCPNNDETNGSVGDWLGFVIMASDCTSQNS